MKLNNSEGLVFPSFIVYVAKSPNTDQLYVGCKRAKTLKDWQTYKGSPTGKDTHRFDEDSETELHSIFCLTSEYWDNAETFDADDQLAKLPYALESLLWDVMKEEGKPVQNRRPQGTGWSFMRRGVPNEKNAKPLSDEAKVKISEKLKGKNSNDTFSLIMQNVPNKGKPKPANIYRYGTDEIVYENVILNTWCKENNVNKSGMTRTARGVTKHFRGLYARYL
jgi:hypothetical protein